VLVAPPEYFGTKARTLKSAKSIASASIGIIDVIKLH
jgi:hypothetical protein